MKSKKLLMTAIASSFLLCSVNAMASVVYKCTYYGNSYEDGPFQNYYTLIVDGHQVTYYLEVNKVFDGSDLDQELRTQGNRLPAAGIGTIAESDENGDLRVIGDSLISQYDAQVYHPLSRYLLVSGGILQGAQKIKMSIVSSYHDGRSNDPTRALKPGVMPTSCVRTK